MEKVVLVNFWANGVPAYVSELPANWIVLQKNHNTDHLEILARCHWTSCQTKTIAKPSVNAGRDPQKGCPNRDVAWN